MKSDPELLLTQALAPGEKIVWSDQTHRLRDSVRVAFRWPWLVFGVLCFVGIQFWALSNLARIEGEIQAGRRARPRWRAADMPSLDYEALAALGGGAAILGFAVVSLVRRALRQRGQRFAATDAGRLLLVTGDRVRVLPLPPGEGITTRAKEGAPFGDVLLVPFAIATDPAPVPGLGDLVLVGVADPLATVATLRSVAKPWVGVAVGGAGVSPAKLEADLPSRSVADSQSRSVADSQ